MSCCVCQSQPVPPPIPQQLFSFEVSHTLSLCAARGLTGWDTLEYSQPSGSRDSPRSGPAHKGPFGNEAAFQSQRGCSLPLSLNSLPSTAAARSLPPRSSRPPPARASRGKGQGGAGRVLRDQAEEALRRAGVECAWPRDASVTLIGRQQGLNQSSPQDRVPVLCDGLRQCSPQTHSCREPAPASSPQGCRTA